MPDPVGHPGRERSARERRCQPMGGARRHVDGHQVRGARIGVADRGRESIAGRRPRRCHEEAGRQHLGRTHCHHRSHAGAVSSDGHERALARCRIVGPQRRNGRSVGRDDGIVIEWGAKSPWRPAERRDLKEHAGRTRQRFGAAHDVVDGRGIGRERHAVEADRFRRPPPESHSCLVVAESTRTGGPETTARTRRTWRREK